MEQNNNTEEPFGRRIDTKDIAAALESYNAWRRGANTEQPNPTEIGRLLDAAIKRLRELDRVSLGSAEVESLLAIEKAILNPRQEILLEDRNRPSILEAIAADRNLAATTRDMIRKLGLINIHVLQRVNVENHYLPCFKVVFDDMPLL